MPTSTEWEDLSLFFGPLDLVPSSTPGSSISGGKLKNTGNIQDGTGLWESPNLNATNESGFTAIPAGFRYDDASGNYLSKGKLAEFWSSSVIPGTTGSYSYYLLFGNGEFRRHGQGKSNGLSIRCIKDNTSGINEINPENKSIFKIYDLMGNETTIKPNEILLYHYSDGSVEKKIIFE